MIFTTKNSINVLLMYTVLYNNRALNLLLQNGHIFEYKYILVDTMSIFKDYHTTFI